MANPKERMKKCREKKSAEEKANYNAKEKLKRSTKRSEMSQEERDQHRAKDRLRKAKKVADRKRQAEAVKKEKNKAQNKVHKRRIRAERSEIEIRFEKIEELVQKRKSRAKRNEEEQQLDNHNAKKGMQWLKEDGRVMEFKWRYNYKMDELDIWQIFWNQGEKERDILKERKPDVDARLRARMREQSERAEDQKRNLEEKDKTHDKIMQESAPEGFVWSGGMEGEYHWAGEGEQPEHTKESKFWNADFNDMQPVTKEDEERFEKQKVEWLNYEIQKMREEKSQYMRNYNMKKKAALQVPIEMSEAQPKSEYMLLQERNILELEERKKASGLFED